MTISINGTNITDYIARRGLKWQRSDIDAANSGRTMDGVMHRGRVASKIRLDITCRPLTASELAIVEALVLPEYVTVTYNDPLYGSVTKTMYSNNTPASYEMVSRNGVEWWSGVTFPLIEQ